MADFLDFIANFLSNLFSLILDTCVSLLGSLFGILSAGISAWLVEQGFSLSIPNNVFNVLDEITLGIGYIFPLYSFIPIVTFMLTFYVAKAIFSVFVSVTKFFKLKIG